MGAAGEGERPDAKQNASAPPHADQAPRGRQRKRPEASRGRAGRTHRNGGKPVTRTRNRARPAAKTTRPTAQRRPAGAGAATPPPHAPARARPRQRGDDAAARRAATAQAGQHQGAIVGRPLPAISAEKTLRDGAQAASVTDAEREGQGAPANPPELLVLHPLGRGRTRQKRGAAARQPPRQTQQRPPSKQPPPDHTPAACGGKRILGRRQALGMA